MAEETWENTFQFCFVHQILQGIAGFSWWRSFAISWTLKLSDMKGQLQKQTAKCTSTRFSDIKTKGYNVIKFIQKRDNQLRLT
jgi:hypothetical protein